ncbi:hypothetical protein HZA96_06395 [Candidatus Woesearchaeota archaeon]|nr:hypothetical protein [Candidatus Woesearchaeota archaeon]
MSKTDNTLRNLVHQMATKEKKVKEFKKRLRIKGKVIGKSLTKKGNYKIAVERDEQQYNFIILKSHKDKYLLVEKLPINAFVSIEGIHKFKFIICTRLKQIKNFDESKQIKLGITWIHNTNQNLRKAINEGLEL